jgi:hypothetical protein
MSDIVSAVFDNSDDAQAAVDWLRAQGAPEDSISAVAQNAGEIYDTSDLAERQADADMDEDEEDGEDAAKAGLTGLGVGAGVGAIFGLAAAAIPGVGPFITAGALASALGSTAGGAVAGAIVGGVSGGLASTLAGWGVSKTEADYYANAVERGNTYVGVNLDRTNLSRDSVIDAFRRYRGRFAS